MRKRALIQVTCANCGEEREIRKDQKPPAYCKKCAPIFRDSTHYDCHKTHGLARVSAAYGQAGKAKRTKVYTAYYDAKRRCTAGDSRWSKYYRDVEFRFESFEQWYEEIGDPPSSHHTIDRINNLGHYEPGNIRWTDWATQRKNQRERGSISPVP